MRNNDIHLQHLSHNEYIQYSSTSRLGLSAGSLAQAYIPSSAALTRPFQNDININKGIFILTNDIPV